MGGKHEKYICIHGHFYQPPRESAWTGKLEKQPSAAPYHDWNERITDECYRPNCQSAILDEKGKPIEILNNYSLMSFNFGPTLMSWIKAKAPDVCLSILEADEQSQDYFSGHGSAMAQAYNHMIMPLANSRDKRTQIDWGIRDFEYHFKREPEGMWLPEAAVDLETLDIMAEFGIKFTVLAPNQAKKVKRKWFLGGWRAVNEKTLDTRQPYFCRLPSGRQIAIFFYDGGISNDVAFGGLLHQGDRFAERLMQAFPSKLRRNSLVHIATDGETYGHHHRFGNMALAYCLYHIQEKKLAHITNYGEYLEMYPPRQEVKIHENSSWSCAHGVERWRSNCGCRIDHSVPPQQEWRKYLREALDRLRTKLGEVFTAEGREYFVDPWQVRDEYFELLFDKSELKAMEFFNRYAKRRILPDHIPALFNLFEMQHYAMLMYTSCGWFFDDISRIETIQILQYAAKAMDLAKKVSGHNFEPDFEAWLEPAQSSEPHLYNGKHIYQTLVKPGRYHYDI